MKLLKAVLVLLAILVVALISGCKSAPATSTPSPVPPLTPPTTSAPSPVPPLTPPVNSTPSPVPPLTPPTTSAGPTYGSMAALGQTVFAGKCAGCHGANGQGGGGPAVIGAGSSLGKYGTGKGLFDFVSVKMPRAAPGSLPRQDYLNVVSYLLVQNNFAFPATAFDESAMNGIQLK